ncbi:hypothetical protein SEA_NICOLE72_37 [Microbacterium phage Nicole72]|uniref:Uncharacterized protein n=1 Tax=Microbacterium phage Nicole72 TaxID=3062838 RepID=A0ACD4UHT4_9CAUD|nr:hypothetical protein SEA_NICOLE72_37 [Microbacterium phage Nicole72]
MSNENSIGEVVAPVPEVPEDEREPVKTWELRRDVETYPGAEPVETFAKGDG